MSVVVQLISGSSHEFNFISYDMEKLIDLAFFYFASIHSKVKLNQLVQKSSKK